MQRNLPNFSSLFYHSPVPTLIYERSTFKILEVNIAATILYKYSKAEFLDLNMKDLCVKKIESTLNFNFIDENQNQNICFGTCTHQTKAGELIDLEINGHAIDFENKKCIFIFCQNSILNETQKSKIDIMMETSLDVFCIVNEQDKFEFISTASLNHWGYLPEELIGKSIHDLIFEDDQAKTNQIITSVQKGTEIKSFVNRYKKKDGTLAYNLWSAKWDSATNLRYAVAKDYSEKIEQDEKLNLSEQRFKALVQEGSDLLVLLDAQGRYIYLNPTNNSLLGFEQKEFLGKYALDYIHPDDAARAKHSLQRLATEKKVILAPYRFKNNNNEWRWMETVLTNLLDNPAVQAYVANSRDVTEEKKLKELIKQTSTLAKIGSWELNLENQNVFWSDVVHNLHETDSHSYIPTSESGILFYREDFQQMVKNNIDKCISFGEPFDYEAVLVTLNKKEIWVRVIGTAECTDGKCVRIFGSFQDINDLKETENKLISFSENLPGIIYQYLIRPDGTDSISFVSGDVEQLWGYTAFEVKENINLVWAQISNGGDFEQVQASIAKSIETKSRWTSQFRHVMPTGEQRIRLGTGTPTFLADGTIVFNSMVVDVTQEAKNEELLKQANDRFEKVTEATNDAIWDWNLIDKTYYRSAGIDNFFRKDTSKSFSDENFWNDNFHPEDIIKLQESIATAIDNRQCNRWELEYRIFNQAQEIMYVSDRGMIIRNDKGIAIRMIGAMTNISEQKKLTIQLNELNQSLQQYTIELEQSNEELEQFAFVASHDLQEPLRMISSFMDLLKRKYSNVIDEKGQQYINFATTGAKRMQQIIFDLLEYAKVNKVNEDLENIDINELISDFRLLRKKLISEKNATIIAVNLPSIKSYKAAITQIIHCLVDNALKYTSENKVPEIEIKIKVQEIDWEFSIKDNGIGIDKRFFSKIFVIFQRLHNKEEYAGTGIGLSIAKKHIDYLGGRIWLESEVGKGTIFYFTIPKQ